MRSRFVALVAPAVGAPACGLASCRVPATEIDLSIDTPCRRAGQTLDLVFFDASGAEIAVPRELEHIENVAWPYAQTLAPRDQDLARTRWSLRATLSEGGTELVSQRFEGSYEQRASTSRTLLLEDPRCSDAGPLDSGTLDSGTLDSGMLDSGMLDSGTLDSGTLDSGTLDSGTGLDAAPSVDAAPLPGCERRPYRRTAPPVAPIEYRFTAGAGRSVVNASPSAELGTDLEGSFLWLEGCAVATGSPRPSVVDPSAFVDALALCDSRDEITIEAWLTVTSEPSGDAREEVFAHGLQGTEYRGAFELGIANGVFIAATNGCDAQARPLYRFPRPPGLAHVVYTQTPLDGSVDAGIVGEWGLERAYVNGVAVPLRFPVAGPEFPDGCVPPGSMPGLRHFGVAVGTTNAGRAGTQTAHLGGAPWGGFGGCYHLLAIYCSALTEAQAHDNYCAGPPR